MKIVFTGYTNTPEFNDPQMWLSRIKAYIGIPGALTKYHEVISIEQINYQGIIMNNGVQYHFLNYKKRGTFFFRKLHSYIKKLSPDALLIHSFHFPLHVLLLRFQLGKRLKIIVQNHAEKPAIGLKKIAQQLADKFINAYMFTSVEMGEEWVKAGIISNYKKIWGIMEASSFFKPTDKYMAKERTGTKGKTVYLFAGRLDSNKDPLNVVKAFLEFKKNNEDAHLYLIYHTTELLDDIKKILADDIDGSAISLIGQVPHDDMIYWFNSADFIISGSHYEGSGVAVCEGMSCGCIPVVTNILSFQKITANGSCGLLYEPGNEDALVQALLQTTKMNIAEESKKAVEQFNKELSFDAIALQMNEKIMTL